MYPKVQLRIGGSWQDATDGKTDVVINPATAEAIGTVPVASVRDLDRALAAAAEGFSVWRRTSALERSDLLRKAAHLLRERTDDIARILTLEQGKRLAEARVEIVVGAEFIEWYAEEGRRVYGRVVPSRMPDTVQIVSKGPVGPVAAFTPWNFPINQAVRKIAAALAAGCSIILKGPEETPASVAELVRVFTDAGLPDGVLNLVFGVPSQISEYLIAHDTIRKISFTGSTAVGKELAALGGRHMKRVTMELGGHAPAIVFDDADVEHAAKRLITQKFWNAGQVCASPSRFLVQSGVYERFSDQMVVGAKTLNVGDGFAKETRMGPLANLRRINHAEELVADAVQQGARLLTGGKRIGNVGFFFQPTVLADVPITARIMNEEPFVPIVALSRFDDIDEAILEGNRLRYGLAAYVFSSSPRTVKLMREALECGSIGINTTMVGLPEQPFGGVKDSGYGSEGGPEGIEPYLETKNISEAVL